MSTSSDRQRDKTNVAITLYFCEEATFENLLRWTQPRLDLRRLGEAVASLIAEGTVVVEQRRKSNRRIVQIVKLAEENPPLPETFGDPPAF